MRALVARDQVRPLFAIRFAPGFSNRDHLWEVTSRSVDGRTIVAAPVGRPDMSETLTLRRNGNFAVKGRTQWQMYVPSSEVA